MDILSLTGLVLGVSAILFGQYLEGGQLGALLNWPAMLVVSGGTFGAVMLQSKLSVFLRSLRLLAWVFFPPRLDMNDTVNQVVSWSRTARKEGLLGLENAADRETNEFVRKALQLLIDGSDPNIIRTVMEVDISVRERFDIQASKVFESMGGYSPTIGIIAAVLGLIQVMGNLSDPSLIGSGIAVAFVATIYGVGFANLVLLPIASKLRLLVQERATHEEMLIEGLACIAEGENPRNIEMRLLGFFVKQ